MTRQKKGKVALLFIGINLINIGMNTMRLIFEHNSPIILNNELTVDKFPFALDYPHGSDLIIDTFKNKFIFRHSDLSANSFQTHAETIQINENIIIIHLKKPTPQQLSVTHASSHFIFPKRYIVELGNNGDTTYFTIYSKSTNKIAINLNIRTDNPGVMLEQNKIILRDDNISFSYDPITNKILEHKIFYHTDSPIPFQFLQHLKNNDLESAEKLLAFKISPEKLATYFGKFDIILNNYLNNPSLVSIKINNQVKTLHFTIQNNLIQNIE